MIICVANLAEQLLPTVNCTRGEQPLDHCGNVPKWYKEPKEEDQTIVTLESAGGSRTNGGHRSMNDGVEKDEKVSVSGHLMRHANEELADSLPTSNNHSFDLLVSRASGPAMFPVVSPSRGAQP